MGKMVFQRFAGGVIVQGHEHSRNGPNPGRVGTVNTVGMDNIVYMCPEEKRETFSQALGNHKRLILAELEGAERLDGSGGDHRNWFFTDLHGVADLLLKDFYQISSHLRSQGWGCSVISHVGPWTPMHANAAAVAMEFLRLGWVDSFVITFARGKIKAGALYLEKDTMTKGDYIAWHSNEYKLEHVLFADDNADHVSDCSSEWNVRMKQDGSLLNYSFLVTNNRNIVPAGKVFRKVLNPTPTKKAPTANIECAVISDAYNFIHVNGSPEQMFVQLRDVIVGNQQLFYF